MTEKAEKEMQEEMEDLVNAYWTAYNLPEIEIFFDKDLFQYSIDKLKAHANKVHTRVQNTYFGGDFWATTAALINFMRDFDPENVSPKEWKKFIEEFAECAEETAEKMGIVAVFSAKNKG